MGWRTMGSLEWKELEEFLFARAMEHDSPKLLFRQACEYLASARVVRPGVVRLLEHVAAARARAREETWTQVAHLADERRRAELDGLLVPDPALGRTRLAWLGVGPTTASPAAVKAELAKLAYLRGLDAHALDLSAAGGAAPVPGWCGPAPDGAGAVAAENRTQVPDLVDAAGPVGGRRAGRGAAAVRPGAVGAGVGGEGEADRGPR
nr:DUF4158 domain-containing protein [Carbonactinospora thermoautotrophica]